MKKTNFINRYFWFFTAAFLPNIALACICIPDNPSFCSDATDAHYILTCVVKGHPDSHLMDVDVLENLHQQTTTAITIFGQDGVNCGAGLWGFDVQDTLVLAVSPYNGYYYLSGCGEYSLRVENDQVVGQITDSLTTLPLDIFSADIYGCAGINLPVELAGFSAKEIKSYRVQLDWSTHAEINFSHYEIEYSQDAYQWTETLGRQEGIATSGGEYSFIHTTPARGINYYRLKLVDLDGTVQYSEVESVKLEFPRSYQPLLFPNPTKGDIVLQLPFATERPTSITVFDARGRIVFALPKLSAELRQLTIPTAHLPSGVYMLQHSFNGIASAQKFVVY